MNIAIIGDYNKDYPPHPATTQSLGHASSALGLDIKISWIPSDKIKIDSQYPFRFYSGVWLGPAPYHNIPNVNWAIRYIRKHNIPFLGTCGGLYQSLTEFGKNVLKLDEKVFEKRGMEPCDDFFLMDSSCGIHGFKTVHFQTVKDTETFAIYNQVHCEEDSNRVVLLLIQSILKLLKKMGC
ncbi:MAG: hypothetical protein HC830_03090 [Bacteroidetes bacterium]|nr:hypothetical protein [Bacteroidota bacterium]